MNFNTHQLVWRIEVADQFGDERLLKKLIQCLKELEGNGIIQHKVYRQVPPKVEYLLSVLERKLRPIFNELVKFGLLYEKK